jgi:hypothetical protein
MWHTPQGVRVLRGPEARLFLAGVLLLQDQVEDSLDSADQELNIPTGSPTFDAMEPEAKIIALAVVTKGLLDAKTQAVNLEQWHQSAVLAVYMTVKTNVQVEIGMERSTEIRQQIRDAYLQSADKMGEYDTLIDLEHDTCTEWHTRIDSLTARVVDLEAARKTSRGGPSISSRTFNKSQEYLTGLRHER